MQQIKTIEVDGTLEYGELKYSAVLPGNISTPVKIIVVYNEQPDEENPLNKLSRDEFARQFREALIEAGYDTNEKIAQLVKEVKIEQAKELGLL